MPRPGRANIALERPAGCLDSRPARGVLVTSRPLAAAAQRGR